MGHGLKKHLHVILRIYRRDLGRLLHNRFALVVIIGVLFLPSVYAWYTIAANMDPYAHTDAIKVAIVDEDKGATEPDIGTIDAGSEVVTKLKENKELGWEFVSADEAKQKVESGAYYAALVIPETFSKDLISVFSGNFSPPTIDYYVNEKISAVAPEITDVGASTITASIDEAFIEAVSKTVASIAQKLGDTVKSDESTAQTHLGDAVNEARSTISSLNGALSDFTPVLSDARTTVNDAQSALSSVDSALSTVKSDESDAEKELDELRTSVATFGTSLSQNLQEAAAAASQATTDEAAAITTVEGNLATQKAALEAQLEAANAQGQAGAAEAERLQAEITALNDAQTALAAAGGGLSTALEGFSSALSNASSTLSDQTLPSLESSLGDASAALGTLQGADTAISSALSTATTAVGQFSATIDMADKALTQAQSSLSDVDQSLEDSYNDLAALATSTTVESLSRYLSINPEQLGEFMASPVKLQTEVVYPVKNYGSGVAPFFTNLALWVAGFILVALLRMRIDRGREDEEPLPPLTFSENYFGRAALFLTLGLIQGLIVCCGDLVLGIQCDNPVAFVFAGLVTVFVDINILYALVFTMRHLGRAIGVIVLIMQIPGSSGEYPVQMMPAFFQFIHPLLPFTYSIDAMREAIGGMYGTHYWIDLLCLLPFLGCALAFGLICGRYSTNLNVLFDRELSRTDLLISEEADGSMEQFRLRSVVQALLASETYHDELIRRMERFRKRYPRLIRGGWIFVAVVGVVALILGRLLGGDIDGKVIALGIVVATVFVVLGYQIVVAFINDRLVYQLQVSTLETGDLQAMARTHLITEPPAALTPPPAPTPAPAPVAVSTSPAPPTADSSYPDASYPTTPQPAEPTYPVSAPDLNAPYPGMPVVDTPYPGMPVVDTPYPGMPVVDAPYPGMPLADTSYPGMPPIDTPYPGAPPAVNTTAAPSPPIDQSPQGFDLVGAPTPAPASEPLQAPPTQPRLDDFPTQTMPVITPAPTPPSPEPLAPPESMIAALTAAQEPTAPEPAPEVAQPQPSEVPAETPEPTPEPLPTVWDLIGHVATGEPPSEPGGERRS